MAFHHHCCIDGETKRRREQRQRLGGKALPRATPRISITSPVGVPNGKGRPLEPPHCKCLIAPRQDSTRDSTAGVSQVAPKPYLAQKPRRARSPNSPLNWLPKSNGLACPTRVVFGELSALCVVRGRSQPGCGCTVQSEVKHRSVTPCPKDLFTSWTRWGQVMFNRRSTMCLRGRGTASTLDHVRG